MKNVFAKSIYLSIALYAGMALTLPGCNSGKEFETLLPASDSSNTINLYNIALESSSKDDSTFSITESIYDNSIHDYQVIGTKIIPPKSNEYQYWHRIYDSLCPKKDVPEKGSKPPVPPQP